MSIACTRPELFPTKPELSIHQPRIILNQVHHLLSNLPWVCEQHSYLTAPQNDDSNIGGGVLHMETPQVSGHHL